MIDILVLGATGCIGELVTRYLNEHEEFGEFSFGIAGRSEQELLKLAEALQLNARIPIYEVDITNEDELDEVICKAKVVINTVGPFISHGEQVVRVCARLGVHYVDINAEAAFNEKIVVEYDYLASKTGAIIVPSCGWSAVPSDALAYLGAKTIRSATSGQAAVAESHSLLGGDDDLLYLSSGAVGTLCATADAVSLGRLRSMGTSYAISPMRGPPLGDAYGQLLYTLPHLHPLRYGVPSIACLNNRAIVQRTWGVRELGKLRGIDKENTLVTYGNAFSHYEARSVSGPIVALLLSVVTSIAMSCLFMFSTARWIAKHVAGTFGRDSSAESLEHGGLKATNVSISTRFEDDKRPLVVRSSLDGQGESAYLLTSIMAAESGLALLTPSKLTPLAREGGVLTPMSALGDVLLDRLSATGHFEIRSEILREAS